MKRLLLLLIAACVIAVSVTACGNSGSPSGTTASGGGSESTEASAEGTEAAAETGGEEAAAGGEMTVGAASGIPQLNPAKSGTAWEEVMKPLLWDGLTKLNQEGEPEADLATKWTPSAGNKTWTFDLRPGVKWSNGKPLTAEDIVKTFENYLDPDTASQWLTSLEPIQKVSAKGNTVVIDLKKANALLPNIVSNIKIIDMSSLKSIDQEPVVSGPFMVKSFTPEVEVTMVPNPEFFGEAPKLEELKLVKESDSTAAVTALRAGDLDALWSIPASDAEQLASEPSLQMIEPEVTGVYVSWEMDMTAPPFNDLRAREALAYATDREAILKAAYYNLGEVSKTNTPLAENSPWFGGNLKEFPYDVAKAKKLFEEAGVTKLTWWGVSDQYPEWNTSAQILQASLKEAGVTLDIKNSDLSTWPDKFYPAGKSYPGLIIPNFQSYQANPYSQFSFPLSGRCECNWNSDEFDSTFEDALAASDEGERNELWNKAQEIINREVPLIIPVQPKVVTAAKSEVAGVWVDATGTPHFESAGFAG